VLRIAAEGHAKGEPMALPEERLNVDEMTDAAADAASRHPNLELIGVTTKGDSGYAELLVRVLRPKGRAQLLSVGVFRTIPLSDFRREVARRLHDALLA
jgi:hypothetical protein